jgi:hypothetical protein
LFGDGAKYMGGLFREARCQREGYMLGKPGDTWGFLVYGRFRQATEREDRQ